MKILLTGAAGFIGSHLAERLVNEKYDVIGLDNMSAGNINNLRYVLGSRNFKLVTGDIRDKDFVGKLMHDCYACFHLAAQVHVDRSYIEPELTWDVNVNGTQILLEAAKFHGIEKFIYASSSEVYGTNRLDKPMKEVHPLNPPHIYGASKAAADRMCYAYADSYQMPIEIVRCFNTYGPRQRMTGYGAVISIFARRIMQGQPCIIYGDGTQARDFMYVKDAVTAYMMVLRHQTSMFGPVNFGTGYAITINELAKEIGKAVGMPAETIHVPARIGELQLLVADNSLARSVLNWEPKWTLYGGLRVFIDWFKIYGWE